MPLPKIPTPEYQLILPSTEKPIKYRPFLIKEEKILLLAQQTQDKTQITDAIKQILKECIITRGIKIEELPVFDIEYLFLNIRGKSMGECIELDVTCTDDNETIVPYKLYIDEIQVQKNPEHTKDIQLGPNLVMRMKYPSLDEFIKNNFDFNNEDNPVNADAAMELIASCIDIVFSQEDSWSAKDSTKEELVEYIGTMTNEHLEKIEKFFSTMPVLFHSFTVVNPKTKKETEVKLRGLTSFFG
jgi:hypothetical protein